jgi:hypothetical protein
MYEKLAALGKDAKNKDAAQLAKEAEKIVREAIEQAKGAAGKAASTASGLASGGMGAGVFGSLEHLPGFKDIPHLDSMKRIASERGDEAQSLINETYEGVSRFCALAALTHTRRD